MEHATPALSAPLTGKIKRFFREVFFYQNIFTVGRRVVAAPRHLASAAFLRKLVTAAPCPRT